LLQDIETESDDMEVQQIPGALSQQQQQQQGQQAVALVLPRVEQQTSTTQTIQTQAQLIVEQPAASSQANSSNTVTTTQAGVKRQRDSKGDSTSRTEDKSGGPSQVSRNISFLIEL
jgi:nucleoprotein TPR